MVKSELLVEKLATDSENAIATVRGATAKPQWSVIKKFNISDLIQFVKGDEDIIRLLINLTDVCDFIKMID